MSADDRKSPTRLRGRATGFMGSAIVALVGLVASAGCGGGGGSGSESNSQASSNTQDSSDSSVLELDGTVTTMVTSDDSELTSSELLPVEKAVEGLVVVPILNADHVDMDVDVEYSNFPPAGGPHYDIWQNCGFYNVELRNELVVHSLEHGAVWVTYRSDASPEDLESLVALAERNNYLLVSPYENQQSEIVLSAWSRQLYLNSIDDARFVDFLDLYLGGGPRAQEPGAVCFGGIGVAPDQPTLIPET